MSDITLDIEEGKMYEIIGDELSSKNVLMRVIGGLMGVTSGQVLWDGVDVYTLPIKDRQIGYISEHFNFFESKSVQNNLYYALKIRKTPKKEAYLTIQTLLEEYNLASLRDKKIKELSKVDRIKIAILRLKLCYRRILLIEDVWNGLNEEEIQDCLSMLNGTAKTIIIATTKSKVIDSKNIVIEWGSITNHDKANGN